MINLNSYLIEKLVIDKDVEPGGTTNYIHPGDRDEKQACDTFKTDDVMYCKYQNGRNNVGKVKLMLGDDHFYIKPGDTKKITDKLPDTPHVSHFLLQDLVKVGLGDSYIINAYQSRVDTSSRINNLKRTYHYFYFGENGMIFKDKKEANTILKAAKQDYKLSGEYRYKVITIEDAANMKGSIYGDSIEDIKFIQI